MTIKAYNSTLTLGCLKVLYTTLLDIHTCCVLLWFDVGNEDKQHPDCKGIMPILSGVCLIEFSINA